MMILAIPLFNKEIAPCFEAATLFMIAKVTDTRESSSTFEHCQGQGGLNRARLLQSHGVNVLICDGIKGFYKDLLVALGLIVIDRISLPAQDALRMYLEGNIKETEQEPELCKISSVVPLPELISWTRDLFQRHGYTLYEGSDRAPFPIDLVAEMPCPLCNKPVRVGICCGPHSYRIDRELDEFHRASVNAFHAQVYVHPAVPELEKRCREYGIELIDPLSVVLDRDRSSGSKIPLLRGPVKGHEDASDMTNIAESSEATESSEASRDDTLN